MSDQINKLVQENANISAKLVQIEAKYSKEIADLKALVTGYKAEIEELKRKISTKSLGSGNVWSNVSKKVTDPVQVAVVNTVVNDIKEREDKANNIVIYGLKESNEIDIKAKSDNDKKQIIDILSKVGVAVEEKEILKTVRVTSSINKPKLLIVRFNNPEIRNACIRSSNKLKSNNSLRDIYINPDLTICERQKLKELLKERKEKNEKLSKDSEFYYGIRNGKLVKVQKQTSININDVNDVNITRRNTSSNDTSTVVLNNNNYDDKH
jgi:hypothetical protein